MLRLYWTVARGVLGVACSTMSTRSGRLARLYCPSPLWSLVCDSVRLRHRAVVSRYIKKTELLGAAHSSLGWFLTASGQQEILQICGLDTSRIPM